MWDGQPVRRAPLGEMKLKSEIFRQRFYETVATTEPGTTVVFALPGGESEVTGSR